MSLESATYVNQLVTSNPDGADPKGQGDDHLRLIKNTLKNTFPNLNSAVTVTPAEINALAGGINLVPQGFIGLWAGNPMTVPVGWKLCNGTSGTPNLLDRFVVGAGGSYAPYSQGGSTHQQPIITVYGTSLSVDQLPPHVHPSSPGQSFVTTGSGGGGIGSGGNAGSNGFTGAIGDGNPHTHIASSSYIDVRPPYYALCYIMRTNS